jgi:hypothetical protein
MAGSGLGFNDRKVDGQTNGDEDEEGDDDCPEENSASANRGRACVHGVLLFQVSISTDGRERDVTLIGSKVRFVTVSLVVVDLRLEGSVVESVDGTRDSRVERASMRGSSRGDIRVPWIRTGLGVQSLSEKAGLRGT